MNFLKKIILTCVTCLYLAGWTVSSFAASPDTAFEVLKEHIDQVLEILRNPALKGDAGRPVKEEKVRRISEQLFDFEELSKRSLARNWYRLNPKQRTEFVSLYKSLLEDVYSNRITSYTDEKIIFGKEIALSDTIREIQTTLEAKTGNIPIDYRLIREDGHWKVYDVVIEGVSLISSYRDQFREILANNSVEQMLDILKKKVKTD